MHWEFGAVTLPLTLIHSWPPPLSLISPPSSLSPVTGQRQRRFIDKCTRIETKEKRA
ncbi:hypothetical protein Sjap_001524 [Stephania japonica]|uniref:Uncharacterized protein n=1 Tax=Stephania japonica TaxID=461633 RepID=A0AAP0PTK8_9MAGN